MKIWLMFVWIVTSLDLGENILIFDCNVYRTSLGHYSFLEGLQSIPLCSAGRPWLRLPWIPPPLPPPLQRGPVGHHLQPVGRRPADCVRAQGHRGHRDGPRRAQHPRYPWRQNQCCCVFLDSPTAHKMAAYNLSFLSSPFLLSSISMFPQLYFIPTVSLTNKNLHTVRGQFDFKETS